MLKLSLSVDFQNEINRAQRKFDFGARCFVTGFFHCKIKARSRSFRLLSRDRVTDDADALVNGQQAMFQFLHFSDTHNNMRATEAVQSVASNYPDAYVAITGDVCTYANRVASPLLDELPHKRVWLVPGEHDLPVGECLAGLSKVQWRTPYAEEIESVKIIGLSTVEGIDLMWQLEEVSPPSPPSNLHAFVLLCHNPLSDRMRSRLMNSLIHDENNIPVILCHGHEHHERDFYSSFTTPTVNGVSVLISHVYSANNRNSREHIGAANVIEIRGREEIRYGSIDLHHM